jgi:hypothetical protein
MQTQDTQLVCSKFTIWHHTGKVHIVSIMKPLDLKNQQMVTVLLPAKVTHIEATNN